MRVGFRWIRLATPNSNVDEHCLVTNAHEYFRSPAYHHGFEMKKRIQTMAHSLTHSLALLLER